MELYALGFFVGFLVGLTGIGGGALMTPALIFLGIPPVVAVGTDLLYNATTRFLATLFHFKRGNVNVKASVFLLSGAVPGLVLSTFLMLSMIENYGVNYLDFLLTRILALVLIISSTATIYKTFFGKKSDVVQKNSLLIFIGFVVGILVQLTSVGSGVLVTLFLLIFTGMISRVVVGTELLFGFVLTLLASIIHAKIGNVDFQLALILISSSAPGVVVGVYANSKVDDSALRLILSFVILFMGVLLLC